MSQHHNFPEDELKTKCQDALDYAKSLGVDQADALISMERGFAVTARDGEVETVEHHQEKGLNISVYHDQRIGSASTADLSAKAIRESVDKAVSIAKYIGQDPCNGLADEKFMAYDYPDLQLYHHWGITPEEAIQKAIECETIAREQDKRITNSDGASVDTYDFFRVNGNTHGFMGAYASSRHGISCHVVAQENDTMQRHYEYTASRRPENLEDFKLVAKQAAAKTIQRLGAQKIKTQKCPVIFHSRVAKGLLGSFISAISGTNLYRQSSFLCDHLDKPVFPAFINIHQAPHMLGGPGSAPYDVEGVMTSDRHYIRDGVLTSYVLGSYSARRLGLETTGNASGVYNLLITHGDENLEALCKRMGKGLLVTDLMGQGVRILTGDYSRGAAGFWVEDGEIKYPVEEVTIAGNLKDMYQQIVAVGNDVDRRGNVQTGSILIESMTVAGN